MWFAKILWVLVGLLYFLVCVPAAIWAQETETVDKPAELFFYRCAGCHTIGNGALTGPDLKPSTQWNTADLTVGVKKMEKNTGPMSDEEISQLVDFLKDLNVTERIDNQKKIAEAKLRAELPTASFETGLKLFRGQKALANGGMACIACHRFEGEGGSLGPELTLLYQKSSGIVLQSSIEQASFKVMRPIYEKHKITAEEALHLSEYLSHPERVNRRFAPTLNMVVLLSTFGFGVFFVWLWIMNKQRKGPTRERLIRKYESG